MSPMKTRRPFIKKTEMIGYIKLFLDLIEIRPAACGAVVESPFSGELTAKVLEHVIDEWKCMTTVTGKDYGRMMEGCAAAGPKTTHFHAGGPRQHINKKY